MKKAKELIKLRQDLFEEYKEALDNDEDVTELTSDDEFVASVAAELISNEDLVDELRVNPELMIELCFIVINKKQEAVPFILNAVQQDFVNRLNEELEAAAKYTVEQAVKVLILKGRQQGFTTFISAYILACMLLNFNLTAMTLADSGDNTKTIFDDKVKMPLGLLPAELRPDEKYNSKTELTFQELMNKWRVATAGNKDVGRSKTLKMFHGSEVAFWKDVSTILLA